MRTFFAKLLLFGEYSVILGGHALAVPLDLFQAHLSFSKDQDPRLNNFHSYLSDQHLGKEIDLLALKSDLEKGLKFLSNIPIGYGLGSSGALVAAIYDNYKMGGALDDHNLRHILGLMESFFHGSSSGFDPYIIYKNTPIEKTHNRFLNPKIESLNQATLFLLDTGRSRDSKKYINWFMQQIQDSKFKNHCSEELNDHVTNAISSCKLGQGLSLFNAFHEISAFQKLHMNYMIPDSHMLVWKKALDSNFFKVKLCGAGGGGYLLGITTDFDRLQDLKLKYPIIPLSL